MSKRRGQRHGSTTSTPSTGRSGRAPNGSTKARLRQRGVGTVNHCVHGKDATVEEILDWRPFDYYTVRSTLPLPGGPKVLFTSMFTERPEGVTHVEIRVGKAPGREKDASDDLVAGLRHVLTDMMETYRSILDRQMGSPAAVEEPPMPLSSERFLTNPVHAH
jgi:hypothetical protein